MSSPAAVPTIVGALCLALGSCGSPTQSNMERIIDRIDPSFSTAAVIDAPAEGRAGTSFTVTVRTVGSSTCVTADGGSVSVSGTVARLVPYDQVVREEHGQFCSIDYVAHPRSLSVTLPRAGTATLRVVGTKPNSYDPVLDSVEVELAVR